MGILYDIVTGIVKDGMKEEDKRLAKGVPERFGKMNAITKMAKDAIFSYPVLFSEQVVVNDEDLLFAINRYLETQYGIFTMVAMGLNPVFKGSNARKHILKFYSEESENDDNKNDEDDDSFVIPGLEPEAEISLSDCTNHKIKDDDLKEYSSSSTEAYGDKGSTNVKLSKLESKARATDPTVLNVKLKMADSAHSVEIPIAIKAMPRFISTEESSRIFSYLKEDRPITTFVRLLSGEVKLFRDIIFQLERAKKDKELYSKLGRHPWFRQLMERRNNRRVNGLKNLIPKIGKWLGGKDNDIMPICSLVVTKDEIEKGFSNLWANIKKRDEDIMDKLMLLCLCVVDTTSSTVEFDFYGLKNNTLVKADTLIKESKSGKDNKDMEKLLQTLVTKV